MMTAFAMGGVYLAVGALACAYVYTTGRFDCRIAARIADTALIMMWACLAVGYALLLAGIH